MGKATFVKGQTEDGRFFPSTEHTAKSQRKTLEAAVLNLATSLGVTEVQRVMSSGGNLFYSVLKPIAIPYQSATNTILTFSEYSLHEKFPEFPEPSAKPEINPERLALIQEIAYRKAEQRAFAPGFDEEDWAAAVEEADQQLGLRSGHSSDS